MPLAFVSLPQKISTCSIFRSFVYTFSKGTDAEPMENHICRGSEVQEVATRSFTLSISTIAVRKVADHADDEEEDFFRLRKWIACVRE